jgi:hypothetical protein
MICGAGMCVTNPDVFLCEETGGAWENEQCSCPEGASWDPEAGCVTVETPLDACPVDMVLVGQFATWCGKVNVHTDLQTGSWVTDDDCKSGCIDGGVEYCNTCYPKASVKKVVEIDVSKEKKPFMTAGCNIEYPHPGQKQFACCAFKMAP